MDDTIDLYEDPASDVNGNGRLDSCELADSCRDHCGEMTVAGCWCDPACVLFGDCCPDVCMECLYGDCAPPGPPVDCGCPTALLTNEIVRLTAECLDPDCLVSYGAVGRVVCGSPEMPGMVLVDWGPSYFEGHDGLGLCACGEPGLAPGSTSGAYVPCDAIEPIAISPPTCAADITGPDSAADGVVDALDYLRLIAEWGNPCGGTCSADITGPSGTPDGIVDSLDFLQLIALWGACPDAG
jgi:hypothetical protein